MERSGGWHWGAFFFGPIWYLLNGLPKKGAWLLLLCVATFLLALPFVMFYCGARFKGDLYESKL